VILSRRLLAGTGEMLVIGLTSLTVAVHFKGLASFSSVRRTVKPRGIAPILKA